MKVLPLFKSHYSLGRSILTLEEEDSSIKGGPRSIVDICKENDIDKPFLIEDSMGGFLQAYTNFSNLKINFVFGLRITFCPDITIKDEESLNQSSKYVILSRNSSGYKRLIKIYSCAAKEGFYYNPRMDFENLKKFWSNKDLMLAVPFYDSFIYKNLLTYNACVPDFSFTDPIFFTEENTLPFDNLIQQKVEKYCDDKFEIRKAKSIFYEKKKDFKAYLTFRCINNRSTLNKPQFDHMCSDEFCVEEWIKSNA
jgi:DNA polymerase-3 subunit alpha